MTKHGKRQITLEQRPAHLPPVDRPMRRRGGKGALRTWSWRLLRPKSWRCSRGHHDRCDGLIRWWRMACWCGHHHDATFRWDAVRGKL